MKFYKVLVLIFAISISVLFLGISYRMGYAQEMNKDQALVKAAMELNVAEVDNLLKQHANPNVIDPQTRYPVLLSVCDINLSRRYNEQELRKARINKSQVIKLLVNAGARVEGVVTGGRYTPLLLLAGKSDPEKDYYEDWSMESLFSNPSNKPNVNWKALYGRTALMIAVEAQILPHVEFLLNKRADINAIDEHGRTALDFAYNSRAINGDYVYSQIIYWLHRHGAKTGESLGYKPKYHSLGYKPKYPPYSEEDY